jgi:hypothetical protein
LSPGLATKSTTALPSHEHIGPVCYDTNALHQILTQKSISGPSAVANHEVEPATHTADMPLQQTQIERLSIEFVKHLIHGDSESPDVSYSKMMQVSDQSASNAFSGGNDKVMTSTSASCQDEGNFPDAEPKYLAPSTPEEKILQYRTPTSNDKDLPVVDQPETRTDQPAEMRYTNRQLARIALVAANGLHMTTSQIIIWLAHTFSSLRVGEGGWEMNVRSVLSGFDEFQGRKIPGAHGNKKLYGFSSNDFRIQFETEYSEFLTSSKTHLTPVHHEQGTLDESKHRKSQQPTTKRAEKSASSMSRAMVDHKSRTNNLTPCGSPNIQTKQATREATFNPFERSTPRQASDLLGLGRSIRRETTFNTTGSSVYQPTIETMTKMEKAQKIKQIKARPSRKACFGPGHRLAHKRPHNLEDIHDERDGAWKPPIITVQEGLRDTDQYVDMDNKGNRTLREVFNLPDNIVPVNDGQTELAFKDGTKGKRSRTMYKVGKMFGGELTVRLS